MKTIRTEDIFSLIENAIEKDENAFDAALKMDIER
jgi:hypothetical protein